MLSVPAKVSVLFTVRVLLFARVSVAEVAGAVIVTLFIEVAVAAPNTGIKIWQLDRASPGPLEAKLFRTFPGGFWGLTFGPDSQRLAFADYASVGGLYIWDFLGQPAPRLIRTNRASYVQCESFTPDGRQLVFLNSAGQVITLNLATGQEEGFLELEKKGPAEGLNLCLSPDGTKLALSSRSRSGVDLWELKTGKLLYSLPEQIGTVWWLAWSPDSEQLAISRSDGQIGIWKLHAVERILGQLGL